MGSERRQYVRVRPTADADIALEWLRDDSQALKVIDVSLGGFGLLIEGALSAAEVGSELDLLVTLPRQPPFAAAVVVRHKRGQDNGVCGVELSRIDDAGKTKLRRYVSELFARGQSV